MRSGLWAGGSVRQVSAEVGGLLVPIGDVTIERDLPSPLPGQSSGLGGFSAATGTVEANTESTTSARVGTPWTRAPWPLGGDPVIVHLTDGTNRHPVLVGKVDGSASSMAEPGMTVPIVDGTDALSRSGTWLSVWNVMPPISKDSPGSQNRITGACGAWVVDRHARWAGYYMTPRRTTYTVISAPLSGCTWPEWGELSLSRHADDQNAWTRTRPRAIYAYDRVYTSTFDASWVADSGSPWTQGITEARPLDITAGFRSGSSGSAHVSCQWSNFTIRMACTSSGLVYAQYLKDGVTTSIAFLSQTQMLGSRFVTLRVSKESGWTYRFTLINDKGEQASGSTSIDDGVPSYAQWNSVRAYAPEGAGIAGLLVSYDGAGSTPPSRTFSQSFFYRPDTIQPLDVIPTMTGISSADVIQGQAEAENAAVWLDEDGNLQWRGHDVMRNQDVVATFASNAVADAEIEVDAQDVRSAVTAKYQRWAVSVAGRAKFTLYEGQKDELETGDLVEKFISPPTDTEWVQPNTTPRRIIGNYEAASFNNGVDSWIGYSAIDANGTELTGTGTGGATTFDLERVEGNTFKFTASCQELPAEASRLKLATKSESNDIRKQYQGVGLPLLRGMGIANAVQTSYGATAGPSGFPALVIDLDWHVQDPAAVQARVQWIASELATSRARVRNLELLPDPRLQLGDKIVVEESVRTGVKVTGLVDRIRHTVRAGSPSMTVDLRVLIVSTPFVTLEEFDAWYSGMTLDQLDAKFAGQTLDQIDANPLQ